MRLVPACQCSFAADDGFVQTITEEPGHATDRPDWGTRARLIALCLLLGNSVFVWCAWRYASFSRVNPLVVLGIAVSTGWLLRLISPAWRYWRTMWILSAAWHAILFFFAAPLLMVPSNPEHNGTGASLSSGVTLILLGSAAWLAIGAAASVYAAEHDGSPVTGV